MNRAFVFVKPHAVTDATKALVKKGLVAKGLKVLDEGSIASEKIDSDKLIDQHYYAIASKATILKPHELNVPADKFEGQFGLSWQAALDSGKVMNALDGCAALGLTPDELDTQWGVCKKAKKLIKFGGGFYCGLIEIEGKDSLYLFNGFFMSMRNKFTAPGLSIYYYVVEWEESKLSWGDFRGSVLGPTDPVEAPADSLRGQIYSGWKGLGLAAEPDVGDNGVHASASPFEALAELTNWVGASVEDLPFGQSLLGDGVSAATIKAWSVDPQVLIGGKKGSLFDSVEDMDSSACAAKLAAINKENGGGGSPAAAAPSSFAFYLLAIGVIAGFTLNGLTMEKLTGKNAVFDGEKWDDSKSFIILAQSWFAVISSAIVLLAIGASSGKGLVYSLTANVPISSWMVISLAFLGAHEFGYGALKYIPFPLQVLVKCCKPIPVMMGSVVLAGKKYSFEKYVSIFLLVAGVIIFMMFKPADPKKGSGKAFELDDDTVMGLAMLAVGLLCDAIYGPMQDKVKAAATVRGDKLTPFHNMFAMNLWQGTMKLGMMVYADSLSPALGFIERHPDVMSPLLAQVGTYVFGAMCLYTLIIMFDSLTATTVTTMRKLISILSSVVLYGHPLAPLQGVGVFVVVFSKKIAAAIAGGGKKDEEKKTR